MASRKQRPEARYYKLEDPRPNVRFEMFEEPVSRNATFKWDCRFRNNGYRIVQQYDEAFLWDAKREPYRAIMENAQLECDKHMAPWLYSELDRPLMYALHQARGYLGVRINITKDGTCDPLRVALTVNHGNATRYRVTAGVQAGGSQLIHNAHQDFNQYLDNLIPDAVLEKLHTELMAGLLIYYLGVFEEQIQQTAMEKGFGYGRR